MKKNISYALLTLISGIILSCSSDDNSENNQYLHIPDANFEATLIDLGIDSDGTVNKQMLKTDAENITSLDLSTSAHHDIIDLKGIEGFINLKTLSAISHDIVSINLSKNQKLESLYLQGNQLSSIDLSNNLNLIKIDLQANNFSSSSSIKGLSAIKNLIDFDLSWNYLEEFSIHNTSLEVLHISHNDLKSLNTDGLINLNHLLATSNKLEIVDFSSNTAIETLLIGNNRLQQINLENNIDLTHLYISSNSLINLDVSNNLNLIDLKVDRNPSLTCIKIKEAQNIPSISLSENQALNSTCTW